MFFLFLFCFCFVLFFCCLCSTFWMSLNLSMWSRWDYPELKISSRPSARRKGVVHFQLGLQGTVRVEVALWFNQLLATKTAIFFKAARETFWARLVLDLLFLLEVVVSFKLNPSGWPVRMQLKSSHNIMEAKTGLESIVDTLLNSTVWFISKETSFPSRHKRNVDINSDQVTEEPKKAKIRGKHTRKPVLGRTRTYRRLYYFLRR